MSRSYIIGTGTAGFPAAGVMRDRQVTARRIQQIDAARKHPATCRAGALERLCGIAHQLLAGTDEQGSPDDPEGMKTTSRCGDPHRLVAPCLEW
jgi:hypothetical protein